MRRCRMEEKTKTNPEFDLRRREFLKVGLAAGLVAGIPMGIIPKLGSRKAYAETAEGKHPLAPFVIMTNEKAIEWEDTWVKGIKQKVLGVIKASGEFARLVKGEKGVKVPLHKHHTYHHTYFISGELELGEKKIGPGTYLFVPAGFPHGGFKVTKEAYAFEVFGAAYTVELV
jgi:quercetin dioxygenase-like cupin family protein